MNRNKLRRKIRRQARLDYRFLRINREEFEKAMAVANSDKALDELQLRINAKGINPWKNPRRMLGFNWKTFWANVRDWFVENWDEILEIILTIAPLLLLEPRYED